MTSVDVNKFDTSKVTDMRGMFNGNSLSSLDVSNFNTSNVTNMRSMFQDCVNLVSLDLRSFDTRKVANMIHMFSTSSKLKTIYVTSGKWSTTLAANSIDNSDEYNFNGIYNMFYNCGTTSVTYA